MSRAGRYLTGGACCFLGKKPQIRGETPSWLWPPAALDRPKALLKPAKLRHSASLGLLKFMASLPPLSVGPDCHDGFLLVFLQIAN